MTDSHHRTVKRVVNSMAGTPTQGRLTPS